MDIERFDISEKLLTAVQKVLREEHQKIKCPECGSSASVVGGRLVTHGPGRGGKLSCSGSGKDVGQSGSAKQMMGGGTQKRQHEETQIDEIESRNHAHGYFGTRMDKHIDDGAGTSTSIKTQRDYDMAHRHVKKHTKEIHLAANTKSSHSTMVRHYLDSVHGRHLANIQDRNRAVSSDYIKKDFSRFAMKYKPEQFRESVQMHSVRVSYSGKNKLHRAVYLGLDAATPDEAIKKAVKRVKDTKRAAGETSKDINIHGAQHMGDYNDWLDKRKKRQKKRKDKVHGNPNEDTDRGRGFDLNESTVHLVNVVASKEGTGKMRKRIEVKAKDPVE